MVVSSVLLLCFLVVASSTSTREEREEYGSMSSTADSNFAMRFLGSQSAELAGVVPQLQQMFREKGLRWGSRLFFRQFKYPSAAAIARLAERTAERAARRERECYKIINVEKGWKGKVACPYFDNVEYREEDRQDPLEGVIEVWVENGPKYELFHTYRICTFSGGPGFKLKQGDLQTPEGIYIAKTQPSSTYYLALHVNYPNQFDVLTNPISGRGGSIMIHGQCASIGCSAISAQIVEVYALAKASKSQAAGVPFHSFPFPLTEENLTAAANDPSISQFVSFWRTLKPVYDKFEQTKTVPVTSVAKATSAEILAGKDAHKGYLYKVL